MLVRNEKTYYFAAQVWREGKQVLRQGTINADDVAEAIDRVYDMAKTVWKRSCTEVTIMDPVGGEVLGTSKIAQGDKNDDVSKAVKQGILAGMEHAANDDPKKGFVPWNQPVGPQFFPAQVGKYFTPRTFNKLTGL